MARETIAIGAYELEPIAEDIVHIHHNGKVFVYQSQFACRLLEAAQLQTLGKLSRGESHYCDCDSMTAYLTGAENSLRWPHHTEKYVIHDRTFDGCIQDDFAQAVNDLSFPIAMTSSNNHSGTLLAASSAADAIVAQKKGWGAFELCSYETFLHYNRPAVFVKFIGTKKIHQLNPILNSFKKYAGAQS